MHIPHQRPFKHPFFDDNEDKLVQMDDPQDIPENAMHFEGVGVVMGKDRPNLVSGHGELSGGWPIIPLKRTRG